MAQKLNVFSGRQFLDANGNPYVGAKLFTYIAGSTTKATTTKDLAGLSAHANPIILNSRGEAGDGAGAAQAIWQTEGVNLKLVLAPANDTDPPVSAISTWDNISGINDTSVTAATQWASGPTPTYVSATSFTLVGDQTTDFHVGRRIKTTNTAGAIYSLITDSAYTSLTTITVVNDSGTLDGGLSAVEYGILTSVNPSVPGDLTKIRNITASSVLTLPPSTAGSSTVYTATTGATELTTGRVYAVHVHIDNDGPCTVNLDSLGAKSVKLLNGSDPYYSAMTIGMEAKLRYDGTDLILTNPNNRSPIKAPIGQLYLGSGLDGAKTVAASENLAKGEYHYTSLTINTGQTLGCSDANSGFLVIRVTGAVTLSGTASINLDEKGGAGGAGASAGAGSDGAIGYGGGAGGGGGCSLNQAGGDGGDSTVNAIAALGGAGGLASGASGGTGASVSTRMTRALISSSGASVYHPYGAGGGSAGAETTSASGGIGGGGVIIIADSIIIEASATIKCNGAAGGDSDGGGNAGGRGGGGGGVIILAANSISNSGTITVAGGAAGTDLVGTSSAGGAGGAGYSVEVEVL